MQAEQMKALRKGAGLTQEDLAKAIGMSRKSVVEMETGKVPIDDRTATAVRHAAPLKIESDKFSVEQVADGRWAVVRRTLQQLDNPEALSSMLHQTVGYGYFADREEAEAWQAACENDRPQRHPSALE